MKNVWNRKWLPLLYLSMWLTVLCSLCGCSMSRDDGKKVRDMEFTVTVEAEIPQELKQIIAEKQ